MDHARRKLPNSLRSDGSPSAWEATAWIVAVCVVWPLASPAPGKSPETSESSPPATSATPTSTATELERWVGQLDDDDYRVRRDATEQLIRAGGPAAAFVALALADATVEQLVRGLHVLHQLAISGDQRAEQEALRALERLVNDSSDLVRRRAQKEMDSLVDIFQDRAILELQNLGAVIGRHPGSLGIFLGEVPKDLSLRIDDNWQGTPADLRHFRWLRDARTVYLSGDKVTDAWIPHLTAIRNVHHLRLHRTPLSDEGIHQLLSSLPFLMQLDVWYSDMTDQAFPDLTGRVMWHKARLYGTPKVTEAGLTRMKAYSNEVDFRPGGGLLGIQPIAAEARQVGVVQPGSGADKAGLLRQDVVLTFDGVDVQDFYHLTQLIGQKSPDDTVQVGILRGRREMVLPVVLGAWPFRSP